MDRSPLTRAKLDSAIRIYLTTSGKQTQRIRHPRPIIDMNWRHAQTSSRSAHDQTSIGCDCLTLFWYRDDLILYTITSDATLRVYLPVIDAPQQMQLHASLDVFSAVPFSMASRVTSSRVFWLDREVMSKALTAALSGVKPEQEDGRSRRVREIQEEGWDLFLRVFPDGSLIVQAVAVSSYGPPNV